MSKNKPDFNEMLDSLTGYDEAAIEEHFGDNITNLLTLNATKAGRALVFVDRSRADNAFAVEVLKTVMEMRLGEVNSYWKDDEPAADEAAVDLSKVDAALRGASAAVAAPEVVAGP